MIITNDYVRLEKMKKREEAVSRQSFKCPVFKALKKVLDEEEVIDLRHGLELMKIEARKMPEGAATAALLGDVLQCQD